MLVCLCKGVSENRIKQLVDEGAGTHQEVTQACGAGSDCGACIFQVKRMTQERMEENQKNRILETRLNNASSQ